jgi:single-strand DNA-binding protein|tara:strand:- start:50 stop:436 length:387 start_codon:yes stop_codon:yes gene_type:complete
MLNKMLAIGNVGSDPEMRYTAGGTGVTTFRLAVNNRFKKSDGEQVEETDWFSVVCWARLAETVNEYVHKGMKVYVEGRIKMNTWTAQDGTERSNIEIVANTVTFLDKPNTQSRQTPPPQEDDDESLPW